MKRGRKPQLKGAYAALAEKLRAAGLKPPPYSAYVRTPPALRDLLEKVLERNSSNDVKLPDSFKIVGDWVSCIVVPDGKTVLVNGKDLRLKQEGSV